MRPPAIWRQSPHYRVAPNRDITLVVLHATATPTSQSPLAWLTNPESKVSAHYLIDTDGTLYQLVAERDVAWHAGESEWKGLKHVNHFSIGIELVNTNDGRQPYLPSQLAACTELCLQICNDYGLTSADVVAHAQIATPAGRKNDPVGFPWPQFRASLQKAGLA